MKITGIKCYQIALPMFSTSVAGGVDNYTGSLCRNIKDEEVAEWGKRYQEFNSVLSCIVEMHTDAGIVGYGEAECPNGLSEAFRFACENLIGADPLDIQHNMREVMLGRSNNARVDQIHKRLPLMKEDLALEFAMWDIAGKNAHLPVYDLLGGRVREKQAISIVVGQKPISECVAEVGQALKAGIRTIKVKVGANDKHDIELIKQLREKYGYEYILRVDADGAWGNVTEAVRVLRELYNYNIQYAEGCLNKSDAESYRRIREMAGIPICMPVEFNGNTVSTTEALTKVAEIVRIDAADVISVNPSTTGGILGFTQVAAFCEGAGIELIADRSLSGLSQAIMLHASTVCNSCDYAQTIIPNNTPAGCADDILTEPLTQSNGFMRPPTGEGFGVVIDQNKLKKYTINTMTVGVVE